jgi:hypothetical protein
MAILEILMPTQKFEQNPKHVRLLTGCSVHPKFDDHEKLLPFKSVLLVSSSSFVHLEFAGPTRQGSTSSTAKWGVKLSFRHG